MNHGTDPAAPFRAESWGTAAEGGSPMEERGSDCETCGNPAPGVFSLCRDCYGRLPDSLCTAYVLAALGQ